MFVYQFMYLPTGVCETVTVEDEQNSTCTNESIVQPSHKMDQEETSEIIN